MLVILVLVAVQILVGAVFTAYQIFRIVNLDASSRALPYPKLWGLFSTAGEGQGLIFYLLYRRKHPPSLKPQEAKELRDRKRKVICGLGLLVLGGMIMMAILVFRN